MKPTVRSTMAKSTMATKPPANATTAKSSADAIKKAKLRGSRTMPKAQSIATMMPEARRIAVMTSEAQRIAAPRPEVRWVARKARLEVQ